jgi:hypothetical protein
VANAGTAGTVYLGGGKSVSSANGYPLIPAAVWSGYLFAGDSLFGIATAGTAVLAVFQSGG